MRYMKEIDKKELIKNLFPSLRILEYIIVNEPVTAKELDQHFSKSRSTYYRLLNKFVEFGLVEKIANTPKIKKNAQYIYRSTPKLKLILNIVFHWISDLTLKDNKVELTNPLNFEFLNEILSFFSDIAFPEVKEWIVANWEKYLDPFTFFKDLSDKILQITQIRLENIIFKRIAEKVNDRVKLSEEIYYTI